MHLSKICEEAAGQLNTLPRSKFFLFQDQGNIIVNSFTYSNFSYCLQIWHFCSQRLTTKIENIRKCTLLFTFNDYTSDHEVILNKSNKCAVKVPWLPVLSHEVFSSENELKLVYMQSLFDKNANSKRYKDELKVPIQISSHVWRQICNGFGASDLEHNTSTDLKRETSCNWFGSKCNSCDWQLQCQN